MPELLSQGAPLRQIVERWSITDLEEDG